MALRLSDGLRNFLMDGGSFKQAFSGGRIVYYVGAQPATANAAVTGAVLVTITDASGAHTLEVSSAGSVQVTAGTAGTITSVTVSGIEVLGATVTWITSNDATAALVANQINLNPANYLVKATTSTNTVTLTSRPSMGALLNGDAVLSSVTGDVTTTDVAMGTAVSGVDSVNGLLFEQDPSVGALEKLSSQTWTGVAGAAGDAGYFRLYSAVADAGGLDSAALYMRLDGNIATSGADLNLGTITIPLSSVQSIPTFIVTEPAA